MTIKVEDTDLVTRKQWASIWGQGKTLKDERYNYYELPNGIEAREVSQFLSSFAGQIVQYAIRSGRMDGKVKSSEHRAQDFDKIADFAKWEAERLREHDA